MEKIKGILQQYAEIKKKKKELEAEEELIGPQIKQFILEEGVEEIETDFGKFILKSKRKYYYPEEIVLLEKDLKEKKAEAEAIS